MRISRLACTLCALSLLVACEGPERSVAANTIVAGSPTGAVLVEVPEDHPGNPFYALIFNGLDPTGPYFFFPHDAEWGAAIFERELWCVPDDFNLLEEFDFTPAFPGGPPRSFLCPLTVEGFQVWDNPPNPLPVDPGPIVVVSNGLGAVPVVLAHWDEIATAMADGVLTLPELLALPSAMIGTASTFSTQYVNGPEPRDRLMNKLSAHGALPGGCVFRVQANESQAGTRYLLEVC